MKDIIDLGNLVFNQLVKDHGETEESRLLFLYNITVNEPWIINITKTVQLSEAGVLINFEDSVISDLNAEWKQILFNRELAKADKQRESMNANINKFKDGDTFEFWQNETPWREINF